MRLSHIQLSSLFTQVFRQFCGLNFNVNAVVRLQGNSTNQVVVCTSSSFIELILRNYMRTLS